MQNNETGAAPVGERDDERAAIHQLAFELGGTDSGEYLLDLDDLNAVIDAAYQRAQQPQSEYGDAYQGAREDLAIWKRRAIEAEARVRQQDQIIDQMGEDLNAINGPTFMGEPVIQQPQSAEAVGRIGASHGYKERFPIWYTPDGSEPPIGTKLYTTPQPSAGVVMPERNERRTTYDAEEVYQNGWNACLDEFARLNGKEVGRG